MVWSSYALRRCPAAGERVSDLRGHLFPPHDMPYGLRRTRLPARPTGDRRALTPDDEIDRGQAIASNQVANRDNLKAFGERTKSGLLLGMDAQLRSTCS
jgi:hypothetical protein